MHIISFFMTPHMGKQAMKHFVHRIIDFISSCAIQCGPVFLFLFSHSNFLPNIVFFLLTWSTYFFFFSLPFLSFLSGAVMPVHSRAHRFEVLPNGTLVIQNVQPQDRGTYICSATSFLGRDR